MPKRADMQALYGGKRHGGDFPARIVEAQPDVVEDVLDVGA
ncbi:hypothetical protein [Methylocystis heyeri]|nr:hypothetical protein [Methylocystis heyeri]